MWTISGPCIAVGETQYATYVVVKAEHGNVACRVWDRKLRPVAKEIQPGQTVTVEGTVKSNQSKKDPSRWFTEFEAASLVVIDAVPSPEPGAPQNNDDIPF